MYRELVRRIVKGEKNRGRIDVTIVDDRTIHRLNKRFRHKDKPTDVLAFNYDAGPVLGDVIISRPTTERNAKRFGVTYRQELKRLVIHGALHVLGYDHGRRMSRAEKVYAQL
ncbi:MAG: rRNA maturation RNase YbeY [Candidatus Margulisbacteria bacterium]|jgi:probable rRNA maturation factor|nr:rRNA maturation RNase YbeY [Candidatus Margulisiibacteriota bacterium]